MIPSYFDRLEAAGARQIVVRHDVDMEDRGVVQSWLNQVVQILFTLETPVGFDYLDVLAVSQGDGQPDRNKPFMATLKVGDLCQNSNYNT